LNVDLRKNFLESDHIRAVVKDDNIPMVDEERTGRRKIAVLEVRIWIVEEFVRPRFNRGNLEDKRNSLTDGKAARSTLIFGSIRGGGHRLARSQTKSGINDDREDDRAGDADRRTVGVGSDRSQSAGGEGDDGDDDGSLSYRLSFNLKNELHGRRG
jgi:hypothetical protein